ncbi:metallophosphoesterase [Slackia heliotrinireducens]|uniref:metallophosphoesterase n=1 Tax=Slackia heliotrinireducens TaxID=84110 RepID=UPI003314D8B9
MRTYAMSDIHGCAAAFCERIEQLSELGFFDSRCEDALVLLGDYVDRGPNSLGVIREAMRLERDCPGRVVALLGNHEDDLLRWLGVAAPIPKTSGLIRRFVNRFRGDLENASIERLKMWRSADFGAATIRSLLGPVAFAELENALDLDDAFAADAFERACARIRIDHADEVRWLCGLRLFHETERQIFVHAGIDESLGDSWGTTSRDTMLRSRATRFGTFPKDVIAGHTPTSSICGDLDFHGALWDGASHFYVDGATFLSGRIPVLVYDSEGGTYRELDDRGGLREVRQWPDVWQNSYSAVESALFRGRGDAPDSGSGRQSRDELL